MSPPAPALRSRPRSAPRRGRSCRHSRLTRFKPRRLLRKKNFLKSAAFRPQLLRRLPHRLPPGLPFGRPLHGPKALLRSRRDYPEHPGSLPGRVLPARRRRQSSSRLPHRKHLFIRASSPRPPPFPARVHFLPAPSGMCSASWSFCWFWPDSSRHGPHGRSPPHPLCLRFLPSASPLRNTKALLPNCRSPPRRQRKSLPKRLQPFRRPIPHPAPHRKFLPSRNRKLLRPQPRQSPVHRLLRLLLPAPAAPPPLHQRLPDRRLPQRLLQRLPLSRNPHRLRSLHRWYLSRSPRRPRA